MAILPLYNEDVLTVVSRSFWAASSPSATQVGWVRGCIHSGLGFIHWDTPQFCEMHFVGMSNESFSAGT